MTTLLEAFEGITDTIFEVFESFQYSGVVSQVSSKSGWSDDSTTPATCSVDVLAPEHTFEQLQQFPFYSLIQTGDVIAYVKSSQITFKVKMGDTVQITYESESITYEIQTFRKYPGDTLHIFLLRTA